MAKPPVQIALMIGMPRHDDDRNEDNLDREGDDSAEGVAEQAMNSITEHLQDGGPSAVRALRKFASALEDLCEAYMEKDPHGFEDAAVAAHAALSHLIDK